jgi:hypothetical protein
LFGLAMVCAASNGASSCDSWAQRSYRRLRFDGQDFVSPAAIYPWTLISYSGEKYLARGGWTHYKHRREDIRPRMASEQDRCRIAASVGQAGATIEA